MIILSVPNICRLNSQIIPSPLWLILFHLLDWFLLPLQSLPYHHVWAQDPLPFLLYSFFYKILSGHTQWVAVAYNEKVMPAVFLFPLYYLPMLFEDSALNMLLVTNGHYPGIWKTGNDVVPTWLTNASTVFISHFRDLILVSPIVFSALGSLYYRPVVSVRCMALVWVPLWPSTSVEISSLKE